MSALGQKQTFAPQRRCPLSAISGHRDQFGDSRLCALVAQTQLVLLAGKIAIKAREALRRLIRQQHAAGKITIPRTERASSRSPNKMKANIAVTAGTR